MVRRQAWLAWLAGGVVLLLSTGARGIYLDEEQNITLRARIYSQFSVRTEDSQVFTFPDTFTGQLVQNRNFFNPEVDAKLTSYLNFMNGTWADFMSPDDFRFRIAAWAFYDGIYDYGSAQFDRQQSQINSTFNTAVPGMTPRTNGWFVKGASIKLPSNPVVGAPNFNAVFPGSSELDPRDIYAHQARVNELYLSYSKGPFFLRFGRQSISWGESDTVALLDQSNDPDSELRQRIEQMAMAFGTALSNDPSLRSKVDRWIESAASYIIDAYRHEVADLIETTVAKWDADEAAQRIELQVGRDLQFIRINGTLVGGLAGLAIYSFGRLIG